MGLDRAYLWIYGYGLGFFGAGFFAQMSFGIERLTFGIERLTFGIERLTFGIERLTFGIEHDHPIYQQSRVACGLPRTGCLMELNSGGVAGVVSKTGEKAGLVRTR